MTGPVFTDSAYDAERFVRDGKRVIFDVFASHFIHQCAGGIIVLPIKQRMGNGKG